MNASLSRGDCPWFLAFCPNGAQGDSPGQRPVGSNVAIESRPEGAELNGAEIHASTYPGRRFALPWAISFCPFGAGKQKKTTARGLSPSFLPCNLVDNRQIFVYPSGKDFSTRRNRFAEFSNALFQNVLQRRTASFLCFDCSAKLGFPKPHVIKSE